jgi:hypothetical protein
MDFSSTRHTHYLDHSKCFAPYNSTHEMMLHNESIDELNENNEFTR